MVPLLSFLTSDKFVNCHLFPVVSPGYYRAKIRRGPGRRLNNGSGMVEYRVYTIGKDGHIIRSTPLDCDDDAQAMKQARKLGETHTLEIRSGERFVARLYAEH